MTRYYLVKRGVSERRPLGRWEDRVKEYVSERGVRGNRLEWARKECMDRERWRFVCCGHLPGRCFQRGRGIGAIAWLRNVSLDVKRGLKKNILLPTLTYGSENWTWNGVQQLRVHAKEMNYLRGVCRMSRWDGLTNESVYERCSMRERGSVVVCRVVEWVKRSTLRWFWPYWKGGKWGIC